MTVRNPFTPTFGVDPPLLAGRDAEVAAIRRALANGPGDPARAALLTGARGAGKTVLLNAVERHARDQRWAVVSTTMRPGALAELTETILPRLLNAVAKDQTTVTGASVSVLGIGGGITRTAHEAYPGKPSFRSELEDLATLQQRTGGGVFITLDEVQRGAPDDLREVFHAIQHCFRQGLEVAFVAAGLPSAVSNLLNDEVLTYLRRARRFPLRGLARHEVGMAIRQPILDAGRSIDDPALDLAIETVKGYPFLVQMVGAELWEADPLATEINVEQARIAVSRAVAGAGELLFTPVLEGLSHGEERFLKAMAGLDEDPAPVGEIQRSLGQSTSQTAQLRRRLIAAEVIEPAGHGLVTFAIPGLDSHLRSASAA